MSKATGPPSQALTGVVVTDSGCEADVATRAIQAAVRRATEGNFEPTGSSRRERKSSTRSLFGLGAEVQSAQHVHDFQYPQRWDIGSMEATVGRRRVDPDRNVANEDSWLG